jgi:hypothetical protein
MPGIRCSRLSPPEYRRRHRICRRVPGKATVAERKSMTSPVTYTSVATNGADDIVERIPAL